MDTNNQLVEISYNGRVTISFPFVLTNYCKMLIDDYPFDEQECRIRIGTWIYVKEEIYIVHINNPTSTMPQNNNTVWDIFPYVNDTVEYTTVLGKKIREVHYIQKIKRKSTYYVWVLIAPTFIITALSLAGLYSPFSNEGAREEKVTLGLTTLLTLAVILSMVTGEMPRGSNLPVLGRFVLIEIVMIVVSMAISVMTMFLHERSMTRSWLVPHWLRFKSIQRGSHKIADGQIISNIMEKTYPNSLTPFFQDLKHQKQQQQPSKEIVNLLQNCLQKLNDSHAILQCLKDSQLKKEEEESRLFQWLLVFDRSDLCLFIAFQLIHIVGFVLVFRSYFPEML